MSIARPLLSTFATYHHTADRSAAPMDEYMAMLMPPVRVWVSGKASEDDLGWFGVEPGDDPNFFAGGRQNIPA